MTWTYLDYGPIMKKGGGAEEGEGRPRGYIRIRKEGLSRGAECGERMEKPSRAVPVSDQVR